MMAQSLAKPSRAARVLDRTAWELDREARSLPRAPIETAPQVVTDRSDEGELDWVGFRGLYFPASRRHDLKAIVAYAAYKRSGRSEVPSSDVAHMSTDAGLESASVAVWEGEGGALR
jgi:hypothetical protein